MQYLKLDFNGETVFSPITDEQLTELKDVKGTALFDSSNKEVVAFFEAEATKFEDRKRQTEMKQSALAKLAKVAGLTKEELEALK